MGAKSEDETPFGDALLEGLREAVAWKRGEVALPMRNVPSLTARGEGDPKERRENFAGIFPALRHPVGTLEGWEQDRRQPDPAASVLLRGIERNPKVVEEVVGEGQAGVGEQVLARQRRLAGEPNFAGRGGRYQS